MRTWCWFRLIATEYFMTLWNLDKILSTLYWICIFSYLSPWAYNVEEANWHEEEWEWMSQQQLCVVFWILRVYRSLYCLCGTVCHRSHSAPWQMWLDINSEPKSGLPECSNFISASVLSKKGSATILMMVNKAINSCYIFHLQIYFHFHKSFKFVVTGYRWPREQMYAS